MKKEKTIKGYLKQMLGDYKSVKHSPDKAFNIIHMIPTKKRAYPAGYIHAKWFKVKLFNTFTHEVIEPDRNFDGIHLQGVEVNSISVYLDNSICIDLSKFYTLPTITQSLILGAIEKYRYKGMCDKLRHKNYEKQWQGMMRHRIRITKDHFKNFADYYAIIDEDETLESLKKIYPDIKYYKSWWGSTPCLFMQHSGFEFIFVKGV
jgi:hypothetical protein